MSAGVTKAGVPLNRRIVEALLPEKLPYRVPDTKSMGLAVRVAPSGIKTWDCVFRIRGAGTVKRISLGRSTDVSLDEARSRAHALTSAARLGRDLCVEEQQEKLELERRITVDALITMYLKRRVTGRLRTDAEIARRLRRCLSSISDRTAGDVRRRDIRELLDAVAEDGFLREADKRRQTVGAMFRWALSQDMVEIDPTAGLAPYEGGQTKDRVLSAVEIAELWSWLSLSDVSPNIACILRLQILTGARCGELAGICVEEIDQENWLWTLPAARSKNKRARVTPLGGAARQLIMNRIARHNSRGPLFTTETGSTLRSVHVGQCLWYRRDRLPIAKFSSHDLRRTVATGMVEMGVSLELVARTIGHEAGTRETRTLVRHYVRTDMLEQKASVLAAWEKRLGEAIRESSYTTTQPAVPPATALDQAPDVRLISHRV